jgi:cellulose synthase operon protein YhjQ
LQVGIPESNPSAPKAGNEANEAATPEDVATLYSWANLHGAKYRDFSASRAQAREEARLRVEAAQAEERRLQQEEAERVAQEEAQIAARLAAEAAEAARQAEAERLAEISRQAEAEREAVLAAQEAQRQAALQRSWQPAQAEEGYTSSQGLEFASPSSETATPQTDPFTGFYQDPAAVSMTGEEFDSPPLMTHGLHEPFGPFGGQSPAFGSSFYFEEPAADVDFFAARPDGSPVSPSTFSEQPKTELPFAPFSEVADPRQMLQEDAWSHRYLSDAHESREMLAGPAWLSPEPSRTLSDPVGRVPPQTPISRSQLSEPEFNRADAAKPIQRQVPMYSQPASSYASSFSNAQVPAAKSAAGSPLPGETNWRNPSELPASAPLNDTLTGPRDRIASRWFALKGVFDPQSAPIEQVPSRPPAHVPALAVFSLAGGVGKTSLVASLGRALSSRGERILLVDTAAFGLLPFYFGARDQRPGMLRTFNPPGEGTDAPIQLVTIDPDGHPADLAEALSDQSNNQSNNQFANQSANQSSQPGHQDWLAEEVVRYTRGSNRVLIDLPTASGSTTRRILRLSPVVLVPVLADMNSVVSVGAIESFFRSSGSARDSKGKPILPFYVLNQFDSSLPLHLDVREILRERIGERLLPFALRRSPAVSEALAEGMTVMDYAPTAVVAEDYANLAGWVRSLSAPATQSYRGVRWSER